MISPLGQRQIHVASNMEALRAAHEVAEQQQRDVTRKQAADDRLADSRTEVPEIAGAEGLRTDEREGGRNGQPGGSLAGKPEPEPEDEDGNPVPRSAKPADGHLDFLA